jgi:hypothetical protein
MEAAPRFGSLHSIGNKGEGINPVNPARNSAIIPSSELSNSFNYNHFFADQSFLLSKICTRLQTIIWFRNEKPTWHIETLNAQKQEVQNVLKQKLGAIGCEKWECRSAV